jgi:hypothetical protein
MAIGRATQLKGRSVLGLSLLLCGAFGLSGIIEPEVMTGSAPGARDDPGETGPGYVTGVVQSLPLPMPPSVALELAEALGSGERVGPEIPTAAALAPQRPAPPPPTTVANLLAIRFIASMLYLFVRAERQR